MATKRNPHYPRRTPKKITVKLSTEAGLWRAIWANNSQIASGLWDRKADAITELKKRVSSYRRTHADDGAKVKGGRSVTLTNFTGRVIRKRNGQVQIIGRIKKR